MMYDNFYEIYLRRDIKINLYMVFIVHLNLFLDIYFLTSILAI